MEKGLTPRVVALSNGNGDPRRDSIVAVALDETGAFRQDIILDNLRDADPRHTLGDFVVRWKANVIVVGGFTPSTHRLMGDVQTLLREINSNPEMLKTRECPDTLEAIYVHDQPARIFQNSRRAANEFPTLPVLGRYCVGLARYAQSPLHEYAALGEDMTAILYDPAQKLVSHAQVIVYRLLANMRYFI
jgi:transcription elongation factor SPT6